MKTLLRGILLTAALLPVLAFADSVQLCRESLAILQKFEDGTATQLHDMFSRLTARSNSVQYTDHDLDLLQANLDFLTKEYFADDVWKLERHFTNLALEFQQTKRWADDFMPIVNHAHQLWQHHFAQYLKHQQDPVAIKEFFTTAKDLTELVPRMNKIQQEYQKIVTLLRDFERCTTPTPHLAQDTTTLTHQFEDLLEEYHQQYLRQITKFMKAQDLPVKYIPPQNGKGGYISLRVERTADQLNIDPTTINQPALAPLKFFLEQFKELDLPANGEDHLIINLGHIDSFNGDKNDWKAEVLFPSRLHSGEARGTNMVSFDDHYFFNAYDFEVQSTIVHELTHIRFFRDPDTSLYLSHDSGQTFVNPWVYQNSFSSDEIEARIASVNYLKNYLQTAFSANNDPQAKRTLLKTMARNLIEADAFALTTKKLVSDILDNIPPSITAQRYRDKIVFALKTKSDVTRGDGSTYLHETLVRSTPATNIAPDNRICSVIDTPSSFTKCMAFFKNYFKDLQSDIRREYQDFMGVYRDQLDDFKNKSIYPDQLSDEFYLAK